MNFSFLLYDTVCKHTELSYYDKMSLISSLPVERLTPHLFLNIYILKKKPIHL